MPGTEERRSVVCGRLAEVRFEVERIADNAGYRQTGGSGASCWGYNQSNIVRCGEEEYALSWRDDLTLVVFRRVGPGEWEESPPLPPASQNGNLLVDSRGYLHAISGANGSYHVRFDPPGQVRRYTLQRLEGGDSRFGAGINERDQILVAGGLGEMAWYVLDPAGDYAQLAAGKVVHEMPRGYDFVVFRGNAGHVFCSDDYFVEGEQYRTQVTTYRDLETGEMKTSESPRGIYPVLRSYYYYNPDLLENPDDWRMQVVSDVSDTFCGGERGTTEQQDLMLDEEGNVHLIYFENRQPSSAVWAGTEQDCRESRLFHAVGELGGTFEHYCLGNFNSGRLYQGLDGRMHYLLTRGLRSDAESLWYAVGEAGKWDAISEPVRLSMPSRFWHLFINTVRAGGTRVPFVDCYWTGPYRGESNQVWYGKLIFE